MAREQEHWEAVHRDKAPEEVSWYQPDPATSLRLVTSLAGPGAAVVDVGAGASLLVDGLLARGYADVTVVDIADAALAAVRARLGGAGQRVRFVRADVRRWSPDRAVDLWHDRAVFHFLVDPDDRAAYVAAASAAVRPGGHLVVATFAEDGPEQCSGLPVRRWSAPALAAEFEDAFEPVAGEREEHATPWGAVQPFTWVVLRRRA